MAVDEAITFRDADMDTVLEEDIDFEGELQFEKPLLIKGKFKGKISDSGELYVGEKALVEAQIEADKLCVRGRVQGNAHVSQTAEFYATAEVRGNLETSDLYIEHGAKFTGNCVMKHKKEKA
jgi:cytoskeletal protein CcmA (bactofilin family)